MIIVMAEMSFNPLYRPPGKHPGKGVKRGKYDMAKDSREYLSISEALRGIPNPTSGYGNSAIEEFKNQAHIGTKHS